VIGLLSATGPIATVLILAHVGVGIVGYGTNALAGWDASEVLRGRTEGRRFLDGSVAPSQLAMLWVPILGALLVALVDPEALGTAWFLVAFGAWCVSVALVLAVAWPAQRELGRLLAATSAVPEALRRPARRMLRAQQLIVVCYVIAFWLMVLKPGNR